MVDSSTLDSVIDKIGSMYNFRLGSETIDARGDGSVTWTTFSGTGYVQVLTDNDNAVQAGILNVGDALGYFKLDSDIITGSKIQVSHQSEWYDMMGDPIIPHISGNQLLKQINLRKVIE